MPKEYAIVLSCNPAYGFGMMTSINAQNYFGTNADWEIAYEDYTTEERIKISNAFPFEINWTPISELMGTVNDKRTDQTEPLNRFWLAYWLLAHKLLKEKKYKAVCVIQADQFIFVNLDKYFKMAEEGKLISTHYPFAPAIGTDLPYGDDKAIWDRCMCGLFDSVNFISQKHVNVAGDTIHFQEEDPFKGEANHSVIALNRSIVKHAVKEDVIGLHQDEWMCDHMWHLRKLSADCDNHVFDENGLMIKSWHSRWWQKGRHLNEWCKEYMLENKAAGNTEYFKFLDIQEHNYEFVRSFMVKFNDMTPEVKSEEYEHDVIRRPRYELGEE